ncbi:MAG: hypothetical protein V3T83_07455 [Acidobacteriota bacterium]
MKGETAGNPVRSVKWTRRSTRKLARELSRRGLRVCANSSAARAWKHSIQNKLCNDHGLTVTLAHYPPSSGR